MVELIYKPYGDCAILIEWPDVISEVILKEIRTFSALLETKKSSNIIEIRSAYNSILVCYSHKIVSFKDTCKVLKEIYQSRTSIKLPGKQLWRIPVCYEDLFGLDLKDMSKSLGLTKQEIIKRHTEVTYTVYFIGFLPGFLYLGGLDRTLSVTRRDTPRLQVKKGSVAIGNTQTGIYPMESPGGWNVIGNSPIRFFDTKVDPPCFASVGDSIQFYPVSLKAYTSIKTLVDAGMYPLESESIHD